MAFISSVSEAPSDRLSNPRTLAALLPSQAPAAGLAGLAAFWRLGRCSVELAFFRDLGLPGATQRLCGDYSGAGIVATMPGSGLFRVKQVDMGERPVNVEAEHARPRGSPA